MFKSKFLKRKPKTKKDKNTDNPTSGAKETLYDVIPPPNLPDKAIPKLPPRKPNIGRVYNKEAIGDLPLQHVSPNRRMKDLDDDEYGYTTGGAIYSQPKKKEFNFEDVFMDAQQFVRYQENSTSPMISRFFLSPQGKYEDLSVIDISQQIDSASEFDQQDLRKFIVAGLLPHLKANNKIIDLFTLLSCKNKSVRSLCIHELTEMILEIDHRRFSREDLMMLYEAGTSQLFSAITETKKTFSVFQPLIHLGIIFNCFIYLKAIEAMDDWIACIQRVMSTIQSKMKRVMDRSDPDVRVFAETAKCIFELENVDLDDSLLLGEDEGDFLPEFSREEGDIYIEGLASLFHTGNLILRQQSKFKSGVQRLVRMASFMSGSEDEGMFKWFHRLLGQFALRIIFQEHTDVKLEVLEQCEDDLLSILENGSLHHEGFGLTHSLLFHHKERVRTRYREIAKTRGIVFSKAITDVHIQNLMNKCGLAFDVSTLGSQLNNIVERKQCTFCNEEASITCIYEGFPEESTDDFDMYNNTSTVKIEASQNPDRKRDLENELEVLKQIESKDFHRNVARLLAFNQSFPKFYIKERLPGDNLQRRLLDARDKDKIIPIFDLIRIIIQAVQGVIYVHSKGCLVRDITTASFGCTITNNGYFLKLKNFEMAAKPSDFSNDGIISGLIDLDFSGVPIRWAAPESLLEGHYSIYSDVWSVNILADEILNYAAWPYSDISDADINDMVINIVFTHLKPQGFNRPRRVQGLILEGLANVPEQRLKLEALRERLLEVLDNVDGGGSCTLYDTYSGVEGSSTKTYEIPPLMESQTKANSIFERGIPPSIQRYRELDEDPYTVFAMEVAERNKTLKEQCGIDLMEISSDENYKIESEDRTNQIRVTERVTDDFLKYTYNRLKEIDSRKMCVEPWPPTKSVSADGTKLHYRFPRSAHLLDIVLHKYRGETIGPYIELLYELANHVDSFHSAGWIFRSLRAKTVWILETKEKEQTIVVPKFGKYRRIISSEYDTHLEQIRVENREDIDGIQWFPIEAIKAGLYSKESDVYAFGMITWEVMSAFGQEGVVYDQDEERELACIPFNYQQSDNILQHLIEGYIPEKPVKCPDWFYQEVTRPCLLHQKIDRPSMKTILQVLQTRLQKTLPKQVLSLPPLEPEVYKETYQYEDLYDCDETISPTLLQTFTKESKSQDTAKARTPFSGGPPPPPIPLPYRYHNLNEKEGKKDGHCRLRPPPPPLKPRNLKLAPSDTSAPVANHIHLENNQGHKNGSDSPFSLPQRPPPPRLQENSEESILSDINSCKSRPLPNIPEQTKGDGKSENVNVKSPNTKLNQPSKQNRLPLPPKPTKYNTQNNLQTGCKDSTGGNDNLKPAKESVPNLDKKSNPQLPLPPHVNLPNQSDEQTTNKGKKCNLDSVLKSSDFDAVINSSDQMRDTYKGSDFYEVNPLAKEDDTQKGSDFDLSVPVKNKLVVKSDDDIKKSTEIKTKPKILPKPKSNPKLTWYVNTQENEEDKKPSVSPVYVNKEEVKPAIPPRKPNTK